MRIRCFWSAPPWLAWFKTLVDRPKSSHSAVAIFSGSKSGRFLSSLSLPSAKAEQVDSSALVCKETLSRFRVATNVPLEMTS